MVNNQLAQPTALAGVSERLTNDGPKKIMAPTSMVLTIFRMYLRIAAPVCPGTQKQPSPG